MTSKRQMIVQEIIFLMSIVMCLRTDLGWTQQRSVIVDQAIVQTTTVTSKKLIDFFVEDFMIPEKDVKKMVIYDLAGDGFGDRDIARTFPGGKIYLLTPSAKAQKIMNLWSFGGNIKFTANSNDSPELFENAPDSVRAMGAIFAELLRGLRRNYKGVPIKLHLEQDNNVAAIEMWGYDSNLMKYTPPPVNRVPEQVPVMKLIYLEKTVVDSVYVRRN
ncbi:MAG: hypothetical protein ONB16_00650 [candidate division KSB1 bacterium]|nr:hypothetical protein [candidate division KSB1 bacterium]MDZ7319788.1 hypothetical protein [candidate division KSB1 bacterium]